MTNDASVLGFAPDDVITVYESMNNIQIASAGKAPEPAKAYIVGFRNKRGSFSMLAYLYFGGSQSREIYAPEIADFELDAYSVAEEDGVQFLESMGFMMHNLNYRMLSHDQQTALKKELPLFWTDLSDFAKFREERLQKSKGEHEVQEVAYKRPAEPPQTKERAISGVFRAAAEAKPASGVFKPAGGSIPVDDQTARGQADARLARLLAAF
ncbi:MAG: hypothetical protein HY897_10615 [Deltaproteobacteria bacterium]|nr:hypothetical protein [Deltaproteobacteria bacterium]